jgi:hypothetical protein
MIIYHYNPINGEYLEQSEARESPLDPGEYLIPAHATATPPPNAAPGFAAVWIGESWETLEDHRGQTVYDRQTGRARVIDALGPVPEDVTNDAPGMYQMWDSTEKAWTLDPAQASAAVRAERDRRIQDITWRIERYESETRQGQATTDDIAFLDAYVQALRDLPGQEGFPWQGPEDEAVPWPEEPSEQSESEPVTSEV